MSEREKIISALSRLIKEDAIPEWMSTPNKMFDARTPDEMIESGDTQPLWVMIHRLNSGEPSA